MYIPHERVQKEFPLKSRTIQSEKQNCDINFILKKHAQLGIDVHKENLEANKGRYGDFIRAPLYHEAMNQLLSAERSFMELPSDVRKDFNNDPAEFLAFAQDEKNLPEMILMGLADAVYEDPPEEETPVTKTKTEAKKEPLKEEK